MANKVSFWEISRFVLHAIVFLALLDVPFSVFGYSNTIKCDGFVCMIMFIAEFFFCLTLARYIVTHNSTGFLFPMIVDVLYFALWLLFITDQCVFGIFNDGDACYQGNRVFYAVIAGCQGICLIGDLIGALTSAFNNPPQHLEIPKGFWDEARALFHAIIVGLLIVAIPLSITGIVGDTQCAFGNVDRQSCFVGYFIFVMEVWLGCTVVLREIIRKDRTILPPLLLNAVLCIAWGLFLVDQCAIKILDLSSDSGYCTNLNWGLYLAIGFLQAITFVGDFGVWFQSTSQPRRPILPREPSMICQQHEWERVCPHPIDPSEQNDHKCNLPGLKCRNCHFLYLPDISNSQNQIPVDPQVPAPIPPNQIAQPQIAQPQIASEHAQDQALRRWVSREDMERARASMMPTLIWMFCIDRIAHHRPLEYTPTPGLKRIIKIVSRYHNFNDFPWDNSASVILSNFFGRYSAISILPCLCCLVSLAGFTKKDGAFGGCIVLSLVCFVYFWFLLPRKLKFFPDWPSLAVIDLIYVRPYHELYGVIGIVLWICIFAVTSKSTLIFVPAIAFVYCLSTFPLSSTFSSLHFWNWPRIGTTWVSWRSFFSVTPDIICKNSLPAVWNEACGEPMVMGKTVPYSYFADIFYYHVMEAGQPKHVIQTRKFIEAQFHADKDQFATHTRYNEIRRTETAPKQRHWKFE